jgi:hypothetical protein
MKKSTLAVAALLTTLSAATIAPMAYADDSATAPKAGCAGKPACAGKDAPACAGKDCAGKTDTSTGSDS